MPRLVPSSLLRFPSVGLAAILGLSACGGLTPPPQARPDPAAVSTLDRYSSNGCNPTVASVLAGSNVLMAEVRDMVYGIQRDEISDRIIGYDAWVGLRGQPGAVVVSMDGDCRPRQVYARGGARLPAVRS